MNKEELATVVAIRRDFIKNVVFKYQIHEPYILSNLEHRSQFLQESIDKGWETTSLDANRHIDKEAGDNGAWLEKYFYIPMSFLEKTMEVVPKTIETPMETLTQMVQVAFRLYVKAEQA